MPSVHAVSPPMLRVTLCEYVDERIILPSFVLTQYRHLTDSQTEMLYRNNIKAYCHMADYCAQHCGAL